MTTPAFCSGCGAALADGVAYCSSCGRPVAPVAAQQQGQSGIQQGMATGMLELEKLRLKLIPLRITGVVVGLLLWWFVLGPASQGSPLVTLLLLVVCAFGGLYLGGLIGLAVLRR